MKNTHMLHRVNQHHKTTTWLLLLVAIAENKSFMGTCSELCYQFIGAVKKSDFKMERAVLSIQKLCYQF
jgi:hypothetical protein